MKHPRTISYLSLLLTMTLAGGVMASVAPAQARIQGEATVVNTVLSARPGGMTSDCLTKGGQTILLGELAPGEIRQVQFRLKTARSFVGPLEWSVPDGAPIQVQAEFQLLEGQGVMHENRWLELQGDCEGLVVLTITVAEEIPEARSAQLHLSCGELTGQFQMELLPSQEEPEELSEPQSGGTLAPVLPTNEVTLSLQTLEQFDEEAHLPVKITVEGVAKRLSLGLFNGEPLPAGTRYSVDGGESWYLLYEGGFVEMEPDHILPDNWVGLVLLDLSNLDLLPGDPVELEARAYAVGECVAEENAIAELTESQPLPVPVLTFPDQQQLEALESYLNPVEEETTAPSEAPEDPTEPEEEPAQPDFTEESEVLWRADHYFTVPMPVGWTPEQQIVYSAELLDRDETGAGVYVPVDWTPDGLNAVLDEASASLIVYLGATPPKAGTYRLTLECNYEGICFRRTQTTFFINYSTRSDAQEEVPNHE